MSAVDKTRVEPLARTWLELGLRLAVIAGASTALVTLLFHRSLATACLRGAIVFAAAWLVVRAGHAALARVANAQGNGDR